MTIDSHVHFWHYHPAEYGWIDETMTALRRDFMPEDALAVMQPAGIDACVAVQVRQTLDETRWMLRLADEHPFIAGVIGWVDLRSPDLDAQIESVVHPKLLGVRHIVQAEADDFLLDQRFRRGVGRLVEHGLAYDILIYARQMPAAIAFASQLPDVRLVLDHLGKPDIRQDGFDSWRRDLARIAAIPNVCAKLSGLVTEADWNRWTIEDLHRYVNAAIDAFGPERLMFGSDWPVCTLAAQYGRIVEIIRTAIDERPQSEQDSIFGGTARRLWRLAV
ncbi:MAG TPA: amidohydrolase family protein [Vicinamibacterales bacterium]|nr:amidohydrolase family protein [Vicinamibacterales bacterium]